MINKIKSKSKFWYYLPDRIGGFVKHFLYILLSIITLFPVYFIIVSAFKTKKEYALNTLFLPSNPVLQNFTEAFKGNIFWLWLMNSIILTVGSILLSLLVACLAAFAFSKMKFWGKSAMLNIIVSLMVIPPIVMIIPLFRLMAKINLTNNYASVILIYSALLLPFSIYLLTNFFVTIPNSLLESARIDGCTDIRILFSIIIPLSRPAIITLVVVNSLWTWSELLIALIFLQSNKMKTLMVGIALFKTRYAINIPVTMAAMVMATIPMIVLYIFGQRYFVKGISSGAIKG